VLVIIGLGGNALLPRTGPADVDVQRARAREAAKAIAEVARRHRIIVTHGNGPQIGLLALQAEAVRDLRTYPLDVLGAEAEGMLGYLVEQELANELAGVEVTALLTEVVVDALDPAFRQPTKPIGPVYTEEVARRLAEERGWSIARDGTGWRRVVASPVPRSIVGLHAIELLVAAGVVVVCGGGGGIPVVVDVAGGRHGVEAVVDKDRATALLARSLGADRLLLLTDVDAVQEGWGTDRARPIHDATPAELRRLDLDAGSMGPKVEAASWFVETAGGWAGIGALADAAAILRGEAGTVVRERAEDARPA